MLNTSPGCTLVDAAIGVTGHIYYCGMGYGRGLEALTLRAGTPEKKRRHPVRGAVSLVRNLCGDDLFARQFFRPDDQACLAASRPQFAIKGCENDLRVQGFLPQNSRGQMQGVITA